MIAETPRLIIRNWRDDDLELFHQINSDERVMEYFPFRLNRIEAQEKMAFLYRIIEDTGFGFFAIERKSDCRPIGFAGLAQADVYPCLPQKAVEIGWRLAHDYWGNGYASEAARALLATGFDERGLKEIVSFAVSDNARSTAVMKRLGMLPDPERDFDHPRVPDTHPRLKRHVLYSMSADDWKKQKNNAISPQVSCR